MTLKSALAEYERLLSVRREYTPEEWAEAVKKLKEQCGRTCPTYRPARGLMDDMDDENEVWP